MAKEQQPSLDDQVRNLVAKELGKKPEEVLQISRLNEDLGADSLDHIELMIVLEDEFEVNIPDDEADHMQTVGDITAYLRKYLPKG